MFCLFCNDNFCNIKYGNDYYDKKYSLLFSKKIDIALQCTNQLIHSN